MRRSMAMRFFRITVLYSETCENAKVWKKKKVVYTSSDFLILSYHQALPRSSVFRSRNKIRFTLFILSLHLNYEIHNYIPFSFYARILYSSINDRYKDDFFRESYSANSDLWNRQSYNRDFRRFSVSCMYQLSWYSMIDPRVICSEWESGSRIPPISAHKYT
jgi:hypothetical protein